jgi:TetR/AcrR family transcriptional regulator, tetracycline repressor protein
MRTGKRFSTDMAKHFRLSGGAGSMMLPWAERVLQSLVHTGFGVDDAGSILTLVSSVAISAARDASLIAETRIHPHIPEVARALRNREASEFPVLSQVIAAREIETPVERDFEFDLRVIIAGLESLLASRSRPA